MVGNSARKTKKFSKKQGAPTGRVGVEVLLEPTPDGKRHPDALEPALLAPQALDDLVQALDRAGHVGRAESDRGESRRVERGGQEAELVDVEGAEARAEFQCRSPAEVGQLAPIAAVAEDVSSTSPGKTGTAESLPHQSDKPPKVPLAPAGPTSSASLLTSIVARSTFAPVEAAVGNAAGGGGAPTRSGEVVPPEVNERTAV